MTSYHLWRHDSGEVYAVRIVAGVCTGCVGPLHWSEWRSDLSQMHYDDDAQDAGWVNAKWDEFSEYTPMTEKEANDESD